MPDTRTDEDKAKDCLKILEILKKDRESVEDMVDEVIKFVNHSRRKIVDKDLQKGKKTGTDVYDGTALSAANLAADGIHGYVCSQSIHWFDFILPGKMNFPRSSGMRQWSGKRLDEYPEVRTWLDDCEEVQYAAYNRSNFYDFSPRFIKDGITIGTATEIIEEDVKRGAIVFTLPHFRECYIAENQFGIVDTLYREYRLTLRQLVQKFGEDKIKASIQSFDDKYRNNPYQELTILHATYPRADFEPGKLNGKNKPVASMWVLTEGAVDDAHKLLNESGYYELPNVSWRWEKNSDETYGRSPAWDAYVDIMKANQQGRSNLIAGHKMVEPPMVVPEDLKGKVRNAPNGETYIPGQLTKDRMPLPLLTGIQLPYGIEQQERTDKAIREHFHTDFFLALYQASINKVEMTATQANGIMTELAAVLGTRIGRFQGEALNQTQDRVFTIEMRAGRMPQPPEILMMFAGNPIEIDYIGPLSQAQKRLFKMQGIRAGVELIGEISNIFPEARDMVDPDKMVDEGLEAVGFPARCLRSPEAVADIRRIRQESEEIQVGIEQIGEVSKAIPKLQKATQKGSPLSQVTGNG